MIQFLIWAFQVSVFLGIAVALLMLATGIGNLFVKNLTQVCIQLTPEDSKEKEIK